METERIIGCAFDVLNTLGHGFHEKPYEQALVVDFRYHGIPYAQQSRYPILYRACKVGEYVPDLVVYGKVIVDTKTIERITDVHTTLRVAEPTSCSMIATSSSMERG